MWKQFLGRIGFSREKATDIKDLQPGQRCWVEGVSIGIPSPHPAPFSGILATTMTIEQWRIVHHSEGGEWGKANDIDIGQTFFVRDDTGLVRVDRQGWSKIEVPRTRAERVPKGRRIESLNCFREALAGDPLLAELERVGLTTGSEVRNTERVIPDQTRIRVFGEVRATRENLPSGGAFRDSHRLLELIPPGDEKLIIELV